MRLLPCGHLDFESAVSAQNDANSRAVFTGTRIVLCKPSLRALQSRQGIFVGTRAHSIIVGRDHGVGVGGCGEGGGGGGGGGQQLSGILRSWLCRGVYVRMRTGTFFKSCKISLEKGEFGTSCVVTTYREKLPWSDLRTIKGWSTFHDTA